MNLCRPRSGASLLSKKERLYDMNQDISLKENIHYGTKEHPISRLHFDTGAGTPYPEYFFVARHWHHYMEILYIEKGSFEFEINLQSFTLSQGDICILNPGDLHQIKGNSSDTKHNVILFDPCILDFSYEDEMQEKCIRPLISQLALLPNIYHAVHPSMPLFFLKSRHLWILPQIWMPAGI